MRWSMILLVLHQAPIAYASELDEGWAAYERGELSVAAQHVAAAWESGSLDSNAYIKLLELATCVSFQTGEEASGRERAAAIASLTDGFTPGASTPPQVADAVEAARAQGIRLEIRATERIEARRVLVTIDLIDPLSLARDVRVAQRIAGSWQTEVGTEVELASEAVYYVEVVDQHGNVITTLGNPNEPRFAPALENDDDEDQSNVNVGAWVLISTGAAVVVAGAGVYGSGRRHAREIENTEEGGMFPGDAAVRRAERRSRVGLALSLIGLAITGGGIGWRIAGNDDSALSISPVGMRYDTRF